MATSATKKRTRVDSQSFFHCALSPYCTFRMENAYFPRLAGWYSHRPPRDATALVVSVEGADDFFPTVVWRRKGTNDRGGVSVPCCGCCWTTGSTTMESHSGMRMMDPAEVPQPCCCCCCWEHECIEEETVVVDYCCGRISGQIHW